MGWPTRLHTCGSCTCACECACVVVEKRAWWSNTVKCVGTKQCVWKQTDSCLRNLQTLAQDLSTLNCPGSAFHIQHTQTGAGRTMSVQISFQRHSKLEISAKAHKAVTAAHLHERLLHQSHLLRLTVQAQVAT